jgi:hypothetical protein
MIPKASDRLAQHGTPSATLNAFSRKAMFAAFRSEFGDLELGDRGGGAAKCLPCSDRAGCKLSAALYAL